MATQEKRISVVLSPQEREAFESVRHEQGIDADDLGRRMVQRSLAWRSMHERPHLPLLSLFCGPGGLDLGFQREGFRAEVAIDISKECVETHNFNFGGRAAHQRDITQLTVGELDDIAGHVLKPVGVIGGPPCQSFSHSNVHQDDDDPRHRLPEAYAKLLAKLNDREPISFFLFENVPGLLSKRHEHRYRKFKRMFAAAGFEIFECAINAADYGVPQDRARIFIVGVNRGKHPTARWEPPPPLLSPPVTVRETIGDLPEPVFFERGLDPSKFPVHPNHWTMMPKSAKFHTPGALNEGEVMGRSFRVLAWDKPSWTVAYGHREVHIHPNCKRRLSMYEALLLQSFPKHFVLKGTLSAQTRLVSEAVPPVLAEWLAWSIRVQLGL